MAYIQRHTRRSTTGPAWRQFGRNALACWCLFWGISAPITYMLAASIWRMLLLTAVTFLAIEGVDALRRLCR